MHKRHVFYLSGFDPRGNRFYRELLKRESTQWSNATGIPLSLTSAKGTTHPTQVLTGPDTQTTITFLAWDDMVRAAWLPKHRTILSKLPGILWALHRHGTLRTLYTHCWPMLVTVLSTALPLFMGLLGLLLLVLGAALASQGSWVALLPLALVALLPFYTHHLTNRLQTYWTARILIHLHTLTSTDGAALDARLESFLPSLVAALEDDTVDEVVLVGHSFGGILAPILAHKLHAHAPHLANDSLQYATLTLGTILPVLCAMPNNRFLHPTLQGMEEHTNAWIDITSPRDGACCALTNPMEVAGLSGAGPKRLNAQFHKTFDAATQAHGRKHPLDGHFLFLHAPTTPQPTGDTYDWIATLVDPRPLTVRYATRATQPSPLRRS